jgi:GT2 family glycosyltransferase
VISFIVPAYNEELELPSTLSAIKVAAGLATANSSSGEQDRQYEIIVVDDASTDTTGEIAKRHGANLVSIDRRQIAAARNAGAAAARGDILFFVDADTRISAVHVTSAITALKKGASAGSARVLADGVIPLWGRIFMRVFCALYFANKLGAGAFLFTTRQNFDSVGGFDEKFFVGEEVYFSMAMKKIGPFKILREPIVTSGRKLRMYSLASIVSQFFGIALRGKRGACSRERLGLWYDGKREGRAPS